MKQYKALEIVTVNADLVALSDEQARRRTHLLEESKKKGEYKPLGNLTFKAGETFGMDGAIAKTNMRKLEDVSAIEAEAKVKDKK